MGGGGLRKTNIEGGYCLKKKEAVGLFGDLRGAWKERERCCF